MKEELLIDSIFDPPYFSPDYTFKGSQRWLMYKLFCTQIFNSNFVKEYNLFCKACDTKCADNIAFIMSWILCNFQWKNKYWTHPVFQRKLYTLQLYICFESRDQFLHLLY